MELHQSIRALVIALLTLSACHIENAGPQYGQFKETAPGYPLLNDAGIVFMPCRATDVVGRCIEWKSKSDQCVNPRGHDATPPIVPCASIKKRIH